MWSTAPAPAQRHGVFVVGVAGGVLQNRVLIERAVALLQTNGFDVRFAVALPCNDAGISYGQIVAVAHHTSTRHQL